MTPKLFILLALSFTCSFAAFSQNVEFVENKGQWESSVKFRGRVPAGAFYVHDNGFTVVQHHPADYGEISEQLHGHRHDASAGNNKEDFTLRSHSYRVSFVGSNQNPQVIADKPIYTYNNYFIGSDPAHWATACKIYQGVTLKNVYPNIDVRYYSGTGTVKYDLIVHPGGNPANIALHYEGAEDISIKNNELLIKTSVGELKELDPYTYQHNQSGRVKIRARYKVKGNVVSFDIKDYNPKTTLVIDPDLVFCSFSGSTADNWGFTATYGPDGSMFGGGISFDPGGFPVSPGAFQTTYAGGQFGDISIIKLSPDGRNRLYATYLGGSGNEQPHSLVVDAQGNLVMAGRTNSPATTGSGSIAYPVHGALGKVGNGNGSDYDIIITKLNATGTALIGSVRIGGTRDDGVNITANRSNTSLQRNYGDDGRSEVILDGAGNIYVASSTQSLSDTAAANNFPIQNAFQPTPGGGLQDGVVLKFNPNLSTILFSSFIGGSANDAAYVLAIHPQNGSIYVGGGTESNDLLNGTRTGTLGPNLNGGIDGFVSVISSNGAAALRTTYIGTSDVDQVYGVQFDSNGFPYIMGQTMGTWNVINAAWSQPRGKQFIAKLRPDLSAYVYSTMFGKGDVAPDISPVAFLVDRCENVYISGWGGRLIGYNFQNAGVDGLPITPDAIKSSPDFNTETSTSQDFYFFVLQRNATAQLYGSYFGQNGGRFPDHVDGGTSRFDSRGVIYQAICASCGNNLPFPTTSGSWSSTKPATASCNLAMVKIAFNLDGTRGRVRASVDGVPRDTTGCVPLTVDFIDTIQEAPAYEWNFGDGSPIVSTTSPSVSHTFTAVGSYQVLMVAIDSTKCIPRDSSYVTIRVGDNEARPDFNAVKLSPPCDTFRYRFDNTSFAPPGIPFRNGTFTWNFGDGSPAVTTGPSPVFHTYASAGTYNVTLILRDTAYCNSPDTITKQVRVAANVKAAFTSPAEGCVPFAADFVNESQGGQQFFWDFGDGTTSTDNSPSHIYTLPGTYTVRLRAVDSNTCNLVDTTSFTITINPGPVADFTATPQPPQLNTPITFMNQSSADAIRFKWNFGDGDSLITTSRAPLQHEFNLSTTYTTCLTAYNRAGCADTICKPVVNRVEPAVDVPNAFTPLSNDVNSAVFVRGFGIARMRFIIFSRWGEKVFETTDKKFGWDGRYKGKLLPMDVYAYVLDGEFIDGTKFQKKGDITLIR